jgi:hypothetical protein
MLALETARGGAMTKGIVVAIGTTIAATSVALHTV